ncbi:MAG: hypothetical protein U0V72_05700 [Cytophagales bacterium]
MKNYLQIILIVFFSICKSQINNEALETPLISKYDSSYKKLGFKADIFGFLKNNEYFNKQVDGYTLFGFWANSRLNYQAHKKVSLEAGVWALKNFGQNNFDSISPTLSLQIREKNWNFLFGNLNANYSHQLIEPIYNFERGILKPLETGFQARYNKNQTLLDMWVDWQQFTKPKANKQEYISGNLVYKHKPIHSKYIDILFPLGYNVYHKGGQNISLKAPVLTMHHVTIGNILKIPFDSSKNLKIENYYILYKQDTMQGNGYLCNINLQINKLQLITSYWNGYQYNATMGGDLYQSTATQLGSLNYIKRRELLFFRIIYSNQIIPGLNMSIRFEPIYDFSTKKMEHSEGLYFVYKIPRINIF